MADSPHLTLIPRCLAYLVAVMVRYPRTVLMVSFATAAVSGYAFYARMDYRTQRSDLMSPDKDYQKRWQSYRAEFGDDDDMVVVVEGSDRSRMRAAIDAVAGDIGKQPALFERLFYRVDLRGLRNRALLFLSVDQIRAIHDNLQRMGPLLKGPIGILAWKNLNLVNLLRQARVRAGQLDPSTPLADADEQFLTQLLAVSRSAVAALNDPATYRNPWSSLMPSVGQPGQSIEMLDEPQYFFSGDGALAFLLVRPVKEAGSFTPALTSVRALRQIIADRQRDFADAQIGLTGMPVLETDEMEASQNDTNKAGWLALGGVAFVYLVVYRGLRYPLLTVAALIAGTLWSMGWLTLTVGHLNILSSCFAVMLIGIGDYGVLWVTQYEDERRAGKTPDEANRATAIAVGPGILTASFSTALAFFAAMLADFQAVAELGWIAGWGVILCALATYTVLPALITVTDRRGPMGRSLSVITRAGERRPSEARDQPTPASSQRHWLPGLAAHPRWVLAAGVLIVIGAGVAASRVRYDHNLLNLQSAELDSVRWEHKLLERTAGASWCALSQAASQEQARQLKERYEKLPEVSRVVEVSSLVPTEQERKLPLLREINGQLRGLPAVTVGIDPVECKPLDLRREITFLIGALEPQAPVSPQPILEQLVRSLAELRDHPALASGAVGQDRLNQFGRHLATDLLRDLHQLRDVSAPQSLGLADLPAALRDRYVGASGHWLVQAYARDGLWEIGPLEQFVKAARTVDPEATGKPFGTLEGLKAMQQGFAWAGLYALIVIIIVLAVDFRTLTNTLLALAPLAIGTLLTLGMMGILGVALNPANMIALPLIVGVGVDNGVHVLHDYLSRRRKQNYALARTTGIGIAVSALTTILGFGTLMVANHRGLVSLGLVLTLGVTFCMVAALMVLPAALRLMGREEKDVEPEAVRRAA
jgi:uncharacterized protein